MFTQLIVMCHFFFKVLKEEHVGNLIYSPFSLSAVLAMAHAGTKANTSAEIKATLQVPAENEVLNQGYSEVLTSLQVFH